jgi:hypothetical protein
VSHWPVARKQWNVLRKVTRPVIITDYGSVFSWCSIHPAKTFLFTSTSCLVRLSFLSSFIQTPLSTFMVLHIWVLTSLQRVPLLRKRTEKWRERDMLQSRYIPSVEEENKYQLNWKQPVNREQDSGPTNWAYLFYLASIVCHFATTPSCVWAVGWVGYVKRTTERKYISTGNLIFCFTYLSQIWYRRFSRDNILQLRVTWKSM